MIEPLSASSCSLLTILTPKAMLLSGGASLLTGFGWGAGAGLAVGAIVAATRGRKSNSSHERDMKRINESKSPSTHKTNDDKSKKNMVISQALAMPIKNEGFGQNTTQTYHFREVKTDESCSLYRMASKETLSGEGMQVYDCEIFVSPSSNSNGDWIGFNNCQDSFDDDDDDDDFLICPPVKKARNRPAAERNALWFEWSTRDGMKPAGITKKWNEMSDDERKSLAPTAWETEQKGTIKTALRCEREKRGLIHK